MDTNGSVEIWGGELAILNVGEGDTKLTFDKDKPEERKRAAKVVQDMLSRGYALLIKVGEKDGEPVYQRATKFDPETCEYIIATAGDEEVDIGKDLEESMKSAAPKRKRGRPRKNEKRVPAEKTNAVGVARTSGG